MNKVTTTDWSKADEAYARGQQAYLDWCKEIVHLYADGTATQEQIGERYGKSNTRVMEAIKTAEDGRVLLLNSNQLPKDKLAIYLLTTLPDKDFEVLCKPTTTQKEILEYKARLKAPVAPAPQQKYEDFKVADCFKPDYKSKNPWDNPAPAAPKTRTAMQIIEDYISETSNENRIEILKTIRRLEHPDRGGNNDLVAEINLLLEKES